VTTTGLLTDQVVLEQKRYWRNPAAAVFTFAFPVFFLIIFASINSGASVTSLGKINFNQYYVPSIIAYGVMSACYVNVGIAICFRRDTGLLKRLRGTPLPPWAFVVGLVGSAYIVSAILVVITTAIGVVFYDVTLYPGRFLALAVALLVGAACFAALGVAVSTVVPNADAAPAIVNAAFFPIVFLSGTFFPIPAGSWLTKVANVFPVRHFIQAVFATFDPRRVGSSFAWRHLAVMAVWGAVGAVFAARRFKWEPRRR